MTAAARSYRLWLVAALGFAVFYSSLALRAAFRFPLSVSDDARQHVFWMERFRDPTLFPNDIIADYFQAVAPAGYKFIYWVFAKLGVEPLLLSKILPAIIGIVIAWLVFKLFMQIAPDPRGAFFCSLLFCQTIWLRDDVVSGTPRAFLYPLFLAFLLFVVRRKIVPALVMLALQTLFYPQSALVSLGVAWLGLLKWDRRRPALSRDRADYILAIGALFVVAATAIPFLGSTAKFGPAISRSEAVSLLEFGSHGRAQFLGGFQTWIFGFRAGLIPLDFSLPMALLAVGTPVCFLLSKKYRRDDDGKNLGILWQTLFAGLGLWAQAHLFLFKLHLPARYSGMVLNFAIPFLAAIAFSTLWDVLLSVRKTQRNPATTALFVALCLASLLLIVYPHLTPKFARRSYSRARPAELFEFLKAQPRQTVIATIEPCGDFIPTFAHRSILVSAEHAIPYHLGYYRVIRERGRDLLAAITTSKTDVLGGFIERHHVDLFVIARKTLTPATFRKYRWFSDIAKADALEWPRVPLLSSLADSSKVWEDNELLVVDAHAILEKIRRNEVRPSS